MVVEEVVVMEEVVVKQERGDKKRFEMVHEKRKVEKVKRMKRKERAEIEMGQC